MEISEERIWTLYVHIVPKEIRSKPDDNDYFDKYYVGITKRNATERWGYEGYEYKKQVFGNAIRKYGWNNIIHSIIETNLTHDEACQKEIDLINKLQSTTDMGHGYNVTKGGEGFLGIQRFGKDNSFYGKKHTEESKQKMSEHHYDCSGENGSFYGHHHTKENRQKQSERMKLRYIEHPEKFSHHMSEKQKIQVGIVHSKPVYVFDMELNYIGEYPNVISAADELGLTRRVAQTIVNKTRKYDKDYIIRFKSEIESIEEFQKSYIVKNIEEKLLKIENYIYQFDSDFNFITEYKNEFQASNSTGISNKKIVECCRHTFKQIDGFVFEFRKNVLDIDKYISIMRQIKNKKSNRVIQLSKDMKYIADYASINEAHKKTGYSYYSIKNVCDGYFKESNNYVWRYAEVDYE